MSEELQCDFSMLLSQDTIAKVVESYLNKVVLRTSQQVDVVDLQNTEAGYVFSLKYKPKVQVVKQPVKVDSVLGMMMPKQGEYDIYVGGTDTIPPTHVGRAKNGKFVKKEVNIG